MSGNQCEICGFPMVETRAGQFECLLIVWKRQHQAETS